MEKEELRDLLEHLHDKYNRTEFIEPDPISIPHSFSDRDDKEVAGFLAAAYEGCGPDQCLRSAVAYGTAACLTPGTLPPKREDLLGIMEQVSVKSFESFSGGDLP